MSTTRPTPNRLYASTFHRDGTISYWSVYEQRWCRSAQLPGAELAAMSEQERERVRKHLLTARARLSAEYGALYR